MRYMVGAEDPQRIVSKGIRAGQLIERSDDSSLVPGGVLHAVPVGAEDPLCETPRKVTIFATSDWEATLRSDRCPDCSDAVTG